MLPHTGVIYVESDGRAGFRRSPPALLTEIRIASPTALVVLDIPASLLIESARMHASARRRPVPVGGCQLRWRI